MITRWCWLVEFAIRSYSRYLKRDYTYRGYVYGKKDLDVFLANQVAEVSNKYL